jgi:hypothetical protein
VHVYACVYACVYLCKLTCVCMRVCVCVQSGGMGDYLPVMARREELRSPSSLHADPALEDSRQGQMSRQVLCCAVL